MCLKLNLFLPEKQNGITSWGKPISKRISFHYEVKIIALSQAGINRPRKSKAKAELFMNKISDRGFVIALDENGQILIQLSFLVGLKQFIAHTE
jgi:hypothetical protein